MSSLKKAVTGLFKPKEKDGNDYPEPGMEISTPNNLHHNLHVTFDPDTSSFVGIPDTWKKALESMLSKEEIENNPEAAVTAFQFLNYSIKKKHIEPDDGIKPLASIDTIEEEYDKEMAHNDKFHKDFVSIKRNCEVQLWTRPLDLASNIEEGSKTGHSTKLYSTKVYSTKVCQTIAANIDFIFNHWALVFMWKDQVKNDEGDLIFPRTVTYEAVRDEHSEVLKPSWEEGFPEGDTWRNLTIGNILLSPKILNKAARELPCNYQQYSTKVYNCQIWVKELWKTLKEENLDIPDITSFLSVPKSFGDSSSTRSTPYVRDNSMHSKNE